MSLQIYFCGSISGGRNDVTLYQKIVSHLQTFGNVLTEHVSKLDVLETEQKEFEASTEKNLDKYIHDRDVAWLRTADVVIAEVTQTSMGVGFELGQAEMLQLPVLCLFRSTSARQLSPMVQGAHNGDMFVVEHYTQETEVDGIIDNYMETFLRKTEK